MTRIPINEVYFVSEVYFVVGRGRWVSQECQRILINEVYFVSKQACAKRAREREREGGREREKERQAWQEFQSTRCTSSPRCTSSLVGDCGSVKHVENSNQRGVLRFNQRVVIRLQACQEFQSTRCTSSPRCTSSLVGDCGSVKHVENSNQRGVLRLQASLCKASERERERARGREGGREGGREREKERQAWQEFQSTRCISCPNMSRIPINKATRRTSSPSMSRIPINEVYFVSKHVKNSINEVYFVSEVYFVVGRGRWVSQECQRILINEVYFVSKQACAKRASERERERRRGKHVKSSNQRGVLRRWSRTEVSQSSMSRISINEVYFVSKQACAKRERERERRRGKHGKNSNQRGVLRLQACQEFQSTRCTSFQSVSKHVKNSN